MLTGHIREMQKTDPRRVRIVYEKPRWHEMWFNNPRIAHPKEEGDFQIYKPRDNYLRPYCVEKSPRQWTWKAYGPPRGELYFTPEEEAFGRRHAGRVIIEPLLKPGASPNKQWAPWKWANVSTRLKSSGFKVTQIGMSGPNTPLPGTEYIQTRTMRLAAAVIKHARLVVVPEGGLHHVAEAVGCPAVVIFGGYIAPSVTGYSDQVNIFPPSEQWPLGCGMRVKCRHCDDAMDSITIDQVADAALGLLKCEPSTV